MGKKRVLVLFFGLLLFMGSSMAGKLAEDEAITYYNDGVAAQKEGKFFNAVTAYKKVLLMAPNNTDIQKFIANNMGVMYVKKGDLAMAEWSFKEALAIDPTYKPAQMNLGLIYDIKGNRAQAIEYWYKVFEVDKHKPKDFLIQVDYIEKEPQE